MSRDPWAAGRRNQQQEGAEQQQRRRQTHAHIDSVTTKAVIRGGMHLLCEPWCRQALGACSQFCSRR
jgi:hypothetical protein